MYTANNMGWDVRNGSKFTQELQFHPCHTCPVLSEKFCDLFVEMVTNCPVVETSGEQFTLNNPDKATVYVMLQTELYMFTSNEFSRHKKTGVIKGVTV